METLPYRVVVDTREQRPWSFEGITVSRNGLQVPCGIETVRGSLQTGDYSLEGYTDQVCIERKSTPDLIGTLTRGRERFLNELERMQALVFSAVVVEGRWDDVLRYCRAETKCSPVSIDSSILAFNQRFPKTHWYFRPDRRTAAKTAWKILDRFYRDQKDGS